MSQKQKSQLAQKQNPNCPQWQDDLENLKEKRDQLSRAFIHATDAQASQDQASTYRDFAACAALRAEIRPLLADLREHFLTREERRFVDHLEKNYNNTVGILNFFGLLDAQNGTAYTADYAKFNGQQFKVPSWPEIRERLTVGREARQKLADILMMAKKGNRPRLLLTPIGKKISSLAKAIDEKRNKHKQNSKKNTQLDADEKDFRYFPQELEAGGEKENFDICEKGSKTKAQVIKENNGWLVSVAETISELETDPEVAGEKNTDKPGSNWNKLTLTQQMAKIHAYQKSRGQTGLTCEDYLIAQMFSLWHGHPLDEKSYTCLDGVCINGISKKINDIGVNIPCGAWHGEEENHIYLGVLEGFVPDSGMRMRSAVRI